MAKISKADLVRIIKAKCKDCCCLDLGEVKACTVKTCPLHSIRMGIPDDTEIMIPEKSKRGKRGPMSDEHKAKLAAGREKARAAKAASIQ